MRTKATALFIAVSLLLALATPAPAQEPKRNLIEEGTSFEVEVDGFSLNIQYLLSHHGKEIQPVFDDTTAVHGKHSLRLDNPLGDKIYLAFRPIRLAKDAEVTVSGYLKGEGKARVQLMRWPWATVASADVDLAGDWTRFSFPGVIKNDQSYFLWILPSIDTKRIWLDALQIEEGRLGEFRPRALDLSASASAPYNTYWVGDDCALDLKLYAARPAEPVHVSVKVLDVFRKEVARKSVDVAMDGREHAALTVPLFTGDRRGSFKTIVEARQGEKVEKEVLTFAVLKEVAEADPFFAFNHKQVFNEDAERRYAENNEQRELVYANAPLGYTLGLMRKVGAGGLRCFRIAEYQKIEKPSGEYVWRDAYVNLQTRAGLRGPLVVLRARGPKWDADPAFPPGRRARKGRIPTMEEWKKYVRAMVSHYRGKVRYYEVVNEPETIFKDVAVYVARLKAAHDVIRETDPDAKIVAPSYSGSRPLPWIEAFCKADGHKWVDVWAIHYAGRTLPERGMDRTTPTWELIRKYREILVKASNGVDKPLWNTEGGSFYWGPEFDHWPVAEDQGRTDIQGEHYRIPNETLVAAYAPRLQLIEKACGIDRLYSFEFGFYYSQNASKATDLWSMYVNCDGSPSPALVTYNAVADIFAGAEPVALLPLEHHVLAAVFEREGKCVAALWKGAPVSEYPGFEKYEAPVWVDVKLRGEALRLMNMLGHPVSAVPRDGDVRLTATAYPLYLTTGIAPAQVAAAFRSARLTLGPRPKLDVAAEDLIQVRQYSAAVDALKKRLAENPKDLKALEMIGVCHTELKALDAAREAFDAALRLDPDSSRANIGMALCIQNDLQLKLAWRVRMAKAAEYMGKGIQATVERVKRERRGEYSDLADAYRYFYLLQGSTHVPGAAAKALEMLEVAKIIDPEAKNFRTQRMVAKQDWLKKQAEK